MPGRRRALAYLGIAALIATWTAGFVYLAVAVVPVDHYLISYYAVDYRFGFVRRGLAGELVGNVTEPGFFRNAYLVRWMAAGVYLLGLAALVVRMLRDGWSDRRLMLALLLPVLPFGVPFAIYSARPDLFGAVALIVLCLVLSRVTRQWSAALSCAVFGLLVAVLALMHEGIALEFGFGAILAILILARGLTASAQRLCAVLAIAPGLLIALVVATLANHEVSAKVCRTVPHRMIETPFASIKSGPELIDYLTGTAHNLSDYHDWVCGWYLSTLDHTVADGFGEVVAVGLPALIGSFVLGVLGVAATLRAVSYFSGVPLRSFLGQLHGRFVLPVLGALLLVPLFITGVDWTRWLLVVAFDVVVVYVLYASRRPEIDTAPPTRAMRLLPLVLLGFMLIPLGLAPGGGPTR